MYSDNFFSELDFLFGEDEVEAIGFFSSSSSSSSNLTSLDLFDLVDLALLLGGSLEESTSFLTLDFGVTFGFMSSEAVEGRELLVLFVELLVLILIDCLILRTDNLLQTRLNDILKESKDQERWSGWLHR